MKIEIDTKSDGKDELLHIAHMLLAMCGERAQSSLQSYGADGYGSSLSQGASSGSSGGFMNMFGDPLPSESKISSGSGSSYGDGSDGYTQQADPSGSSGSQQSGGDLFSLFQDDSLKSGQPSSQPSLSASSAVSSSLDLSSDNRPRKRDFLAEGYLIPYD
jgi:hypothetical protein